MPEARIAFVTPSLNVGGAANSIIRLGKGLAERGLEVDYVTTVAPGLWSERVQNLELGLFNYDFAEDGYMLAHAYRVGSFLKKQDYDLIFFSNYERFGQAALNMIPDRTVAVPMIRTDEKWAYNVASMNAGALNVLVGVSPVVVQGIEERAPGKPVRLIPNGVDVPPREQYEGRRPHGKPLRLLYVGRLQQLQKNVFSLPEIMSLCLKRDLDVVLDVVGEGEDEAALAGRIERKGPDGRVNMLGRLEKDEVFERYLDSHICLLNSFFEGLPGVLLEAQSCGCVPVSNALDGTAAFAMREGRTGFIADKEDLSTFADAVEKLHDDPELWARMNVAAREHVAERFTIAKMCDSYLELIREALDGKYPLERPRNKCLPVNLMSFRWWEIAPRPILEPYRRVKGGLKSMAAGR